MALLVSPFLLPYILADREDNSSNEVMLSPKGSSPKFMSARQTPRGGRLSSPMSLSPRPTRRSVLEASISELRFDPDLTFMDSSPEMPKVSRNTHRRNALTDLSSLAALPPMTHVSPDRVIATLDESEIGFSNELRASLEVDKIVAKTRKDIAKATPKSTRRTTAKRVRTEDQLSDATPSQITRSVRRGAIKTMDPIPEQVVSIPAETKASRVKRKAVDDDIFPKVTSAIKAPNSKLSIPSALTVPIVRQSPRFASKVLSSRDSEPIAALSCPDCQKVYRRRDLFDKHVREKACM